MLARIQPSKPGPRTRADFARLPFQVLFSAVPVGGNFISLLQGARAGAIGGSSITAGVKSPLGRVANFPDNPTSSLAAITFTGNSATSFGSSTIAAVVMFAGIGAGAQPQYIFANTSSSSGVAINISSAGVLQWTMFGVVARSSSITLAANIPYFIIASQNGSTAVDFLVLRLDTGVILTSSTAGGVPGTVNGTFVVGNSSAIGQPLNGAMASVMFASGYAPLPSLQNIAVNPWGLWYPQ